MSDRNFGYYHGYQNQGDGNSSFRGSHPATNLANEYTEQYRAASGAVRIGRITEVYVASKTCEVNCGTGVSPAIWGGDICALDGSGSISVPNPGDIALIWKPVAGTAIVLARLPSIGEGAGGIPYDVHHSEVDAYTEDRHSFHLRKGNTASGYYNNGQAVDVLPGDQAWMDGYGGVIALLQGLAILKASPMAQIQCNVIDDLVRICARTLEIWNAGGEVAVFNDEGELNHEFTFTHKGPESFGESAVGAPISQDNTDPSKLHKELTNPTKRAIDRVRVDVGHNGDVVHIWVKKPQSGSSGPEGQPMVGVAHMQIQPSGAMTLQTTKEVMISKTGKFPTPTRKKAAWDKEGDAKDAGYTADKNFPKDFEWDESHPEGKQLQEGDQNTYNRQKNVRKYKDHEKDFEGLIDQVPEAGKDEQPYEEKEAFMHLRSDGSIFFQDEARSTVELTGLGSVKVACPLDFLVEAGRDINLLAGRNYNLRSKKHIELTSTEQDIRLKAEGEILGYTKTKGILFETDSEGLPNGKKGEEQVSAGIQLRSNKDAPIELRSVKDKIILHSEKDIDCKVDNVNSEFYVEAPHVYFKLLEGVGKFSIDCLTIVHRVAKTISLFSTDFYQKVRNFIISESSVFKITGHKDGYIHAPGPKGVNVAHHHPGGEWSYTADAHGQKGILIVKRNSPVIAPIAEPDDKAFLTEVDPHTPTVMETWKFNYQTDYAIGGCKWYETVWQAQGESEGTWDLTKDKVDGTEPYPGVSFNERFGYTPSNPENTPTPSPTPGAFVPAPKATYKTGPTSC